MQNIYFINHHPFGAKKVLPESNTLEFGIKNDFLGTDHVWIQNKGLLMLLNKICVLHEKLHYFPEKSKK